MKQKTIKIISRVLAATVAASIVGTIGITAFADSFDVVSIGANLTEEQVNNMYKEFGVDKQTIQEIKINNADERKALLGYVPEQQIGDKTISCSYIKMGAEGSGLKVTTNNLTWVSESMLRNTLITAGINDAEVMASAPFAVSGTGALTGVMKAFEKGSNQEIPEDKKEAANQELVTTGALGDKIGKDEASLVMNEIKSEVIKDHPKNDIQIGSIVNNVVNNYNLNLDENDKQKIISTMSKINDLDYDYNSLKSTLNETSESFKAKLNELGSSLEESGFLDKCINKLKQFGSWVSREVKSLVIWCKGAFSDTEDATINSNGVQYDKNGNIKTEGNIFIDDESRTPEEMKEEFDEQQVPEELDNGQDNLDNNNQTNTNTNNQNSTNNQTNTNANNQNNANTNNQTNTTNSNGTSNIKPSK